MRVPATGDALWTLNLPFEIFLLKIYRQTPSLPHLRGLSPRHQSQELLDKNDFSGEVSPVPFHAQAVDYQHDLWAPDETTSDELEAVVPLSIAKLSPPSTSPLVSYLQGFASPLYRMILFSMANNFAGFRASAGPRIIRFLSRETDETLYQLILSVSGPSGQAIVQNIFKCAIEIGDIRIMKLLLQEKAAEIGLDQLFCFGIDEKIATPIERAVRLRHLDVVELLLSYNVNVNRTYPEYRFSHGGALTCTFDNYYPERSHQIDIDSGLFIMLLSAGGKLDPRELRNLIPSNHGNLSIPVLLSGTRKSFTQWSKREIFHEAILNLEEKFLMKLVDLMVEFGVDLNCHREELNLDLHARNRVTLIDLAAKSGKLDLVRKLYEKKASLTDITLLYGIAGGNEDLIRFLLFDPEMDRCRRGPLMTTPFVAAIRLQKPWLTEFLIDHGAMIQMANSSDGISALKAASDVGNNELLEKIVKEIRDSRTLGVALGIAIKGGMDALAFQLLDAGADVSFGDAIPEALKRRNQPLILALLDADALFAKRSGLFGLNLPENLWQLAVEWGDRIIIQALIDAGVNVNRTSDAANCPLPLNAAIQQNDIEILDILLEAGADVNHPDSRQFNKTALYDAVLAGNINMAVRLLDYGADPRDEYALKEASKLEGDDFLDLILESYNKRYPRGRKGFGSEALKIAIDADDMKRTTKLLRKNADCNSLEEYYGIFTAFGIAICSAKGDKDNFVELLLQEGRSDPNGVVYLEYGTCLSGVSYGHRVTALLAAVEKRDNFDNQTAHKARSKRESTLARRHQTHAFTSSCRNWQHQDCTAPS